MFALCLEHLDELLERSPPRSAQLSGAANNAVLVLAYGTVYDEDRDAIRRAIGVGAQAAAARFAALAGPVCIPLGQRQSLQLAHLPPDSGTHARAWQQGVALAALARDEAALASLAAVELEMLRRSPTRVDQRELDLCHAQIALVLGRQPAPLLAAALSHPCPNTARAALPVSRARVELYRATLTEDPSAQLRAYHEAWHKYWSTPHRCRHIAGAVSMDGLGWLALRQRAGLPSPSLDSAYMPSVDGSG